MKEFITSLKFFFSSSIWNGINAITGILVLILSIIIIPPVSSALLPKPILIPHVKLSPTARNIVLFTPTHVPVVTPTPTQVPTVEPTSLPTVIPSPSPVVDTVQQTMKQFCTSVYNGDENGAFSMLTTEAQQSDYQGDVQKFWDDFREYSGGSGTCTVISCNVTSCDVALSSSMHTSCRDNFTFVDLGHHSWYITDWSPLNNGCG